MAKKRQPRRSDDQTMSAFSCSKVLFQTMEKARKELQMDRSNFIRYCIANELKRLRIKIGGKK